MNRTYGKEPAQQAMMRAHSAVVLELLRLPVREVMRQLREEAGRRSIPPSEYARSLLALDPALLPTKLGGGSARHFSALLTAVSKLARKATGASLPAA